MREKLATLFIGFKAAFDSLVRTYTPQVLAVIVGWLAALNIEVTPELQNFVGLTVAFVFFVLWYGINRLYETISGKASKALTLGIVQTTPEYSPLTASQKKADAAANAARKEIAHRPK